MNNRNIHKPPDSAVNKVAAITLVFWLLKIVCTTLGETFGDFISMTLKLGYTTGIAITAAILVTVLCIQISLRRFVRGVYWLAIIGTTTLGTEISDYIDRTLRWGYAAGSAVLFAGLLLVLSIWYRKYGNLKVYPVSIWKKELLYWLAILLSNSLGTAFGDFLGSGFGLNYLSSAAVTTGVIIMVVALHYATKINRVILFWIAFIFTRPFGAAFGDLLTKPLNKGGLDLGTLNASLCAAVLVAILLWMDAVREKHKEKDGAA